MQTLLRRSHVVSPRNHQKCALLPSTSGERERERGSEVRGREAAKPKITHTIQNMSAVAGVATPASFTPLASFALESILLFAIFFLMHIPCCMRIPWILVVLLIPDSLSAKPTSVSTERNPAVGARLVPRFPSLDSSMPRLRRPIACRERRSFLPSFARN